MGQKANPIGLRLKIVHNWKSIWYSDKDYKKNLHEDLELRGYIKKTFSHAAISDIIISRKVDLVVISVHSAKPGVIIGKRGVDIDKVKQNIIKMIEKNIELNIVEVKKPDLSAVLMAQGVARQLEKRISFRRAMKKVMQSCMRSGAKGVKVSCAGRLAGAEIARTEWYKEGRVPLHTLRANIDYGLAEASTTYGKIGVKVWVYLGDVVFNADNNLN